MADVQNPQSDMDRELLTETATTGKKLDSGDSWYSHSIPNLPEPTRQLFEQYSGIPPAQVVEHIEQMVQTPLVLRTFASCGHFRADPPLCVQNLID